MTVPHAQNQWRKSSQSAPEANCVELASTLDAVRDSKNPEGPVLTVALGEFITAVKTGQIGR